MSIAPLSKLTLVGPIAAKRDALQALQALGCLHLLPLSPPPAAPELAASREADGAIAALRFLAGAPRQRRPLRRDPDFDVDAFVRRVLALKQHIRDVGDRRDFLEHRIHEIRPWGELAFPPEEALAGRHLWFYRLPTKERAALDNPDLPPWSIVTVDDGLLYVVVIAAQEPPADLLPTPRVHVGSAPIKALEDQLDDAEIELEHLRAERVALTRYASLLRGALSDAFTAAELAYAEEQTLDDEALFALQGWVPTARLDAAYGVADRLSLAALVEDPRWDETPPTLLERPAEQTAGVDLALFYQTPHYRGWDPSAVVVVSFALFFAMIIADAGYGALILAGLLLFWRRLGGSARARSWRRVGLINAGAAIGYGALIGSYFGAPPPTGSLLAELKLLSLDDFGAMMALSIGVGVAHILTATLARAWSRRARPSAIGDLGWAAGLVGGVLIWLGADAPFWSAVGAAMLGGGVIAVLLFSSDRPIAQWRDWLWRGLDGLIRLGSVMGAFGDVLSYMRLFALGLASASLALTFNSLAAAVIAAWPGLGVLAAALILLIGHALNFGLALLSGVVHGLRLNYIEFYKWGLPEEGVVFRPFARREAPE